MARPSTGTRKPALLTPDGRRIVVRGRLWRAWNPELDASERQQLVDDLMHARRDIEAPDLNLHLARTAHYRTRKEEWHRQPTHILQPAAQYYDATAFDLSPQAERVTSFPEAVPEGCRGLTSAATDITPA